jgi:hypothetical protein
VISNEKKEEILARISEIENSTLKRDNKDIAIGALCKNITAESAKLANSSDSLTPILRTALVINWKESAMKSRYDRFKKEFPEITTLSALKQAMDSTDALEFCKNYLNINAASSAADKNPKYCLLRELTNGFLEYQKENGLSSEIDAIRHWSAGVKDKELKSDFIGKRHGVGPGVIRNIKLNLGERVIKPDRHVIGVMKEFLKVDIPFDRYNEFSMFIGLDPRYLDCILFEYGKLKNISAQACAEVPSDSE